MEKTNLFLFSSDATMSAAVLTSEREDCEALQLQNTYIAIKKILLQVYRLFSKHTSLLFNCVCVCAHHLN